MVEAQQAMRVQVAGVAGGEQNAVEHRGRIHGAFVPIKNLHGAVTAILPALVRPMAL